MRAALHSRLVRLEHRAWSPVSPVVILAGPWPDTSEQWEAIVPGEQATVYADPYAVSDA